MLSLFTRKLCPLLSLALATMGCGKKISEGETTTGARSIEGQEPPSTLLIRIEGSENKKVYEAQQNANIVLPEALLVRSGSAAGKTVVISYNLRDAQDSNFDYKCSYKASPASPHLLPLVDCVNSYGDVFTDVGRYELPLTYGRLIKIEFQGGNPGATLDAVYTVDWI